MNKEQGVVSSSTSSSSKGNNRRVSPTDASDSKNLDVERTIGIDERDASQIDAIDTSTNQLLSLEEESLLLLDPDENVVSILKSPSSLDDSAEGYIDVGGGAVLVPIGGLKEPPEGGGAVASKLSGFSVPPSK